MKPISKILFYAAAALCMLASTAEAQKKMSYGGYFELGGKAEYKDVYVESFYRAKLEFEMKINEKVKVEVDIRADSENRQFEIYEAAATFKLTPNFKLEVGDLKKRFGLEEQVSHEKLPTIKESMINEYLEPFGYVNREPGVQLHWTDDEKITAITGGFHYNESHKSTLMSRLSRAGLLGFDNIGINLQYSIERRLEMPDTYAVSMDFAYTIGSVGGNLEIFHGQDPIESYYRVSRGDYEKVKFFGIKSLTIKKFIIDSDLIKGIEPFIQPSILVRDMRNFDVNTVQLTAGINLYFDDNVRFMINGNLDLTNHSYDKDERTLYGSGVYGQLQVRW